MSHDGITEKQLDELNNVIDTHASVDALRNEIKRLRSENIELRTKLDEKSTKDLESCRKNVSDRMAAIAAIKGFDQEMARRK